MTDPTPLPPGIRIEPLATVEQAFAASAVLAEVWHGDHAGMPPNMLRALAHAGSYTMGLYDGDRMVGASVGFFAEPAARSMHSHITGILPSHLGLRLGRALKLHQRDWALARGVDRITWTFDPLVARNAHFNLCVLGVRAGDYLVNHYGPMDDGVNRGDETDRLLVTWELTAAAPPAVAAAAVEGTVAVPRDIEALRVADPDEAAAWRLRVRHEFLALADAGLVVGGFDDVRGYLFVAPPAATASAPAR